MSQQADTFHRIAAAIHFLRQNFQRQPSLEEVAEQVHWSPDHFQRVFTEWAGVSPKKFARYVSLSYAKSLLRAPGATLFGTAEEAGLSGTGRLHDLFVSIEGITPGEWKSGTGLIIHHHFADTIFGKALIAATERGVCHLTFVEDEDAGLEALRKSFPSATFIESRHPHNDAALLLLSRDWRDLPRLKLHLRSTPFQLKVWEALLKIPAGTVATYGTLATRLGQPGAARAVGSAVGDNPVAFLIPCHRVIQSSGALGGYAWGEQRKAAMLGWEAAGTDADTSSNEGLG